MSIIGMIHVKALPGTPKSQLDVPQIMESACREVEIYDKHVDGICIENMHDVPYVKSGSIGSTGGHVGHPEITAIMTQVCAQVRQMTRQSIPIGVQVLAGLNHEALAVALASQLQFIRAEAFVFGHVADEGFIDACAGSLKRYQRHINANHISIFTDIKKKHSSHSITSDVNLIQTAEAAQFFLSDGVIITGDSTGHAPNLTDIKECKESLNDLPIILGSGIDDKNVVEFNKLGVHAAIIGSYFKKNGNWKNDIDEQRVNKLMQILKRS